MLVCPHNQVMKANEAICDARPILPLARQATEETTGDKVDSRLARGGTAEIVRFSDRTDSASATTKPPIVHR